MVSLPHVSVDFPLEFLSGFNPGPKLRNLQIQQFVETPARELREDKNPPP